MEQMVLQEYMVLQVLAVTSGIDGTSGTKWNKAGTSL